MAHNDFGGEQPENYEQKCACVLVLDTSGSMSGRGIDELNAGLLNFHSSIQQSADPATPNRLEVAIITFDSTVTVVQDPALVANFAPPKLVASGSTKLVDGVRAGIQLVEDRKRWYKDTRQDYYRPYLILVTDGGPDGDQDVDGLAREIRAGVDNKRFNFWAFGTDGANMQMLQRISHPTWPPQSFANANFREFFQWLSNSFSLITTSKEGMAVDLTPKNPRLFQHVV